jgi:DNA replication protein DnaC
MTKATKIIDVVPTDLWSGYQGTGQFAPEGAEEIRRFDNALHYELSHRNAPPEYREAYQMPPEARDWAMVANQRRNLILWGEAGVGKTHIAVAAGSLYAAMHLVSFKMLRSGQFLKAAKNHDSRDSIDNARADARLPGVVLIDDIGRSKATDVDVETFTDMMDERRSALRPTIFTTNLLPGEFEECFGTHLTSRFVGGALVIQIVGPDRRATP